MEKLFKIEEASEITGLSRGALATHRYMGTGPAFVKLGKSVLYRESDVEAWIESNVRTKTGKESA